jgi:hypothetical protein
MHPDDDTSTMPDDLADGTTMTCPLCREEKTTVQRNESDQPYFYCAEYEAAVNMNAPTSHVEGFLREFVAGSDETDIERKG